MGVNFVQMLFVFLTIVVCSEFVGYHLLHVELADLTFGNFSANLYSARIPTVKIPTAKIPSDKIPSAGSSIPFSDYRERMRLADSGFN